MKFDVELISPSGFKETHYAVVANTPEEAAIISPILLTISSSWKPEDFKVISVKISQYEDSIHKD